MSIGLDLGKRADYTALAVVEAEYRPATAGRKRAETDHFVRLLQRVPLAAAAIVIVAEADRALVRSKG